jgi:hypothetical protein
VWAVQEEDGFELKVAFIGFSRSPAEVVHRLTPYCMDAVLWRLVCFFLKLRLKHLSVINKQINHAHVN